MEKDDKTFIVRGIPPELKKAFTHAAVDLDISQNKIMILLMREFCAGRIKLPEESS
jgi:hypothetical protein